MKVSLSLLVTALFAASAMADIQDPPANDFGPTRKLGRAIQNIAFGIPELPDTVVKINEREGNASAAGYGVVKGTGRTFFRLGAGVYELVTFPFPTTKGTYRPFYRSHIPWVNGGYTEYAPELGFETKFKHTRTNTSY